MELIRTQSLMILILFTVCFVNTVQSLECYACQYASAEDGTENCLNPTPSTPTETCSTGCGKNLVTAKVKGLSATTVIRSCSVGSTGCRTVSVVGGEGTNCVCKTDLCNDGATVHLSTGGRRLLFMMALVAASVGLLWSKLCR